MLVTRLAAILAVSVSALAASAFAAATSSPPSFSPTDFHVHSISVNHELGGATHSTSQLHLVEQPNPASASLNPRYYIGLSPQEAASLSWSEVNVKFGPGLETQHRAVLPLRDEHYSIPGESPTHLYSIELPKSFLVRRGEAAADANSGIVTPNITIAVDLGFHHVSEALPKAITQKEDASLLWKGDAVPRSVYAVGKTRVKARSPAAKIHRYSIHPTSDEVTKSGATVTFGPFTNIKPVTTDSMPPAVAQVHYAYESPIVSLVQLNRHVEVSHWGDNLAFHDRMWLRNDGPQLKGHFSRVDHQVGSFYGGRGKNLVTEVEMQLPRGARDAYFVDDIGNVSTSHFRSAAVAGLLDGGALDVSTPSHALEANRASYLRLQPRYPLLGGWNYTFTIGWNLNLGAGGWGRALGGNTYSVAVPFWNAFPSGGSSVPVRHVETRIVLPEGAEVLDVQLPFDVEEATVAESSAPASIRYEKHTTYLDTVGRPSIIVSKSRVSQRHAGNVYVTYRLDGMQHMRKLVVVAAVAGALFAAAGLLRRVQGKGA